MFEKNLSCELRVVFSIFAILFLLTALFGKLFAIIGLIITAFVAATGSCMATKIIAPAFCKKSVTDAIGKASDEVKSAADDAYENIKDVADDAVDTIKDKISKK